MVAEQKDIDLSVLLSEKIFEFVGELRNLGFTIDTEQYIAVQDLLLALAAQGELPCPPQQLRTWLAPIICTSPNEQETFYKHFDHWSRMRPELTAPFPEVVEPIAFEQVPAEKDDFQSLVRRSQPWRWWILTTALVFLMVIVAFFFFTRKSPQAFRVFSGRIVDSDGVPVRDALIYFLGQSAVSDSLGNFSFRHQSKDSLAEVIVSHPDYLTVQRRVVMDQEVQIVLRKITISSQEIQNPAEENRLLSLVSRINYFAQNAVLQEDRFGWARIYRQYFQWIRFSLSILPLLIFFFWSAWQVYRQPLLLERRGIKDVPYINRVMVKGAIEQLFRGSAFSLTIQQLRLHREVESSEFDISATVNATLHRGGWFTPIYGLRRTVPEYLVLVDRASFRDQLAHFVDEIVNRLIEDGVFVDRYYFDGDPRDCHSEDYQTSHYTLHELAARHPNHRLMIFSDGTDLMNPLTGRPQRWLELFSTWHERALLIPNSHVQWGYREWALAGLDFMILPATHTGLQVFIEKVHFDTMPQITSKAWSPDFPEMLIERPGRWLERNEVGPEFLDRLCFQLQRYLGNEGYYWLRACAVYPILSWNLTLYFGTRLTNPLERKLLGEERLLRMARLPWFRHGSMPDWLRLRLISSLSTDQERSVRQALEDLFLTALEQPRDGFALEIAYKPKDLRPRGWKRLLQDFFRTAPKDGPLRDYVFLTFMSGRKPGKLAVTLPQILRRAFYRDGQVILGMRPVAGLIFSAAVAILGWNIMPVSQPPPVIPRFRMVDESSVLADSSLKQAIARSDTALSYYSNLFFQQQNEQSLRQLISQYPLPGSPALQPVSFSGESVVSNLKRNQLYQTWLADTLYGATGTHPATFTFQMAKLLDSSETGLIKWKKEPLYLKMKIAKSSVSIDSTLTLQPAPLPDSSLSSDINTFEERLKRDLSFTARGGRLSENWEIKMKKTIDFIDRGFRKYLQKSENKGVVFDRHGSKG